jgi:hypothetical protein
MKTPALLIAAVLVLIACGGTLGFFADDGTFVTPADVIGEEGEACAPGEPVGCSADGGTVVFCTVRGIDHMPDAGFYTVFGRCGEGRLCGQENWDGGSRVKCWTVKQ